MIGCEGLQDCELVAAEAGDDVSLANRRAQALRHGLEQSIADRVAERVVDRLEAVDVDHEHGKLFAAAPQPRERLVALLHEQRAVGEVGEAVVARHMRHLGLDAFLRGDVLMDRDPAAVALGLMHHRDHAAVAQVVDGVIGLRPRHFGEPLVDVFLGVGGTLPGRDPRLEDGAQARSRRGLLGREAVHVRIVPVAHDEPLIAVEHAQALRHVLQREFEQIGLRGEPVVEFGDEQRAEHDDPGQERRYGEMCVEVLVERPQHGRALVADDDHQREPGHRLIADDAIDPVDNADPGERTGVAFRQIAGQQRTAGKILADGIFDHRLARKNGAAAVDENGGAAVVEPDRAIGAGEVGRIEGRGQDAGEAAVGIGQPARGRGDPVSPR